MIEDQVKVREASCPECGALPGELCRGVFRQIGKYAGRRKPRQTNHRARVEHYNAR